MVNEFPFGKSIIFCGVIKIRAIRIKISVAYKAETIHH